MTARSDSFGARSTLEIDGTTYTYFSLPKFAKASGIDIDVLPMSLRLLLENLLRYEDGRTVTREHILGLAKWDPAAEPSDEIAFYPARVVLQDFTGVPAVVDLAAMRDAMADLGGDPNKINPLFPSELVIDHSVQVDHYGTVDALVRNTQLEFERNTERYQLLRWGQDALANFRAVPPGTGIVHQVNLEYLARVVFERDGVLFPDTVLGTDSHTTMINGIGVLGWGVGGIEAEAAMLGEPVNMLVPLVVGVKLKGVLPAGATATDLVLTITQLLRKHGVVAKFVEFYGEGLSQLALADRATIANMSPEFGSTCAIFPIDEETLRYLRLTGRSDADVKKVEAYARAQGLFRTSETKEPKYSSHLEVDLGAVVPSVAGPKRPQDRVALTDVKKSWDTARDGISGRKTVNRATATIDGANYEIRDGSVVIAAITSCTNTSNPYVMLGAALLAKKATDRGLHVKHWVKTSLAPGSQVVTEYLKASGLLPALEAQRFHVVGYGCTTCIGNSGPLPDAVAKAVESGNLVVASVLSGNRNFEGRINPHVRANYLASPPLVVAYALAGYIDFDFETESLGDDKDGKPVFLRDIWPSAEEVKQTVESALSGEMFRRKYSDVFKGEAQWQALPVPKGSRFAWDPKSTYVRKPTYFEGLAKEPKMPADIKGARVLAMLGDSVTTDHISPAGNIAKDSPAARYLTEHGVERRDWNSYGSRRGNHEVMMRGTFANTRLKNQLVPGTEGGVTKLLPDGKVMSIYDASVEYQARGVPLIVIAGKEYGSGSSRDWAAKGTMMLGIRAVIAESYERIHRSNLIGMGVLPLEFPAGHTAETLGLQGDEVFSFDSGTGLTPKSTVTVTAEGSAGKRTFLARVRIDTAKELDYYTHGGILQFVVRRLLAS